MFKNEYTLMVDIKRKMTAITPKFVQYDNATLVFKIFDDGKQFDLTDFSRAEVAHRRADGTTVVGNAQIETLNNGEKVVRYEYLGNEMNKAGYAEASLSVFSTDKKVSIQPFKVEIVKDIRDGLIDNSKKEMGVLQELIAEVSLVLVDAKDAISDANDAVKLANQATIDASNAIIDANTAVNDATNAVNEATQAKNETLIAKNEAELAASNATKAIKDLVHRGNHDMSTQYEEKNIVSFNGSSYIATRPSTGISPTNTAYWKLVANKGDTGAQGIQGVQGIQGDKGDTGKGFEIAKTYPSVADMFADHNNPQIPVGSFVLINTSDVNNVENAMMYVKGETEYNYLTDLSGAQGIRGERGERGIQGIQGIQGERGATGEKGEAGLDGEGFNWLGDYSNTTSYVKNDVVFYNGSSYVALQDSNGNLPTDTVYWSIIAQKGLDGLGSVVSVDGISANSQGDVITHTNKSVLDALTDDAGKLKYNGNTVGSVTSVNGQTGDVLVQGFSGDYADLSNVPAEFTPSQHPISKVTGLQTALDKKIDKVTGKGLSTNDYTTAEKTKLQNIQDGAEVNAITSVNGQTGAITGLATDQSVDNKIGILNGSVNEMANKFVGIDKKMMVSVTDFGAIGDGQKDDTQAIKDAIAYASSIDKGRTGTTHPTVYFPSGRYKLTSTITIDVNFITLKGEGQKQSVIEGVNLSSAMISINSNYGVKLEGLFFLNSATTPSRTIHLLKGEGHIVESCFLENKIGNSAEMLYYQGANTKIRNCRINNFEPNAYCIRVYANTTQININSDIVGNYLGGNGKGIIIDTAEVTRRPEGIKIHENTFLLTGSEQITIKSAYYVDISHNIIDVAKTYNIWITPELAGVDGINITDNYFGNTAEYGQTIRMEDTSVKALNITVSDNYFGISGYAIRGYKNLEGAIITGNYFKEVRQTSISLTESKKVMISGNIEVSTAFSLNISDGTNGGSFIISNNFFTGSMMLTKTTASKFKILNNVGLE